MLGSLELEMRSYQRPALMGTEAAGGRAAACALPGVQA